MPSTRSSRRLRTHLTTSFSIKDSGERRSFESGMVRDTSEGKTNFLSVRFGPMFRRWADHLTKGRVKYPDVSPGTPNWTLAAGEEEFLRAKESAARHFESWVNGERDEDHAAGVFFNINLAEYVLEQTEIDPALGARVLDRDYDGTHPEPEEKRIGLEREGWDTPVRAFFADPTPGGRIIEYTPRPEGCGVANYAAGQTFMCRVPGVHAGRHVFVT